MTYRTGTRERLLEFFEQNAQQSFSLEEVCANLAPDGRGKSTIYRLVAQLVEEGALHKITEQGSRHCTYQFLGGEHCSEHLHLKCIDCGRLIHLDENTSHALEKQIFSSEHFRLSESTLLYGKCNVCQHKCK